MTEQERQALENIKRLTAAYEAMRREVETVCFDLLDVERALDPDGQPVPRSAEVENEAFWRDLRGETRD